MIYTRKDKCMSKWLHNVTFYIISVKLYSIWENGLVSVVFSAPKNQPNKIYILFVIRPTHICKYLLFRNYIFSVQVTAVEVGTFYPSEVMN